MVFSKGVLSLVSMFGCPYRSVRYLRDKNFEMIVRDALGHITPHALRNNMHENREISCTSWSTDQDRSAKAVNRTADMNVQEKSDCAVVPVNQPNNEGQQPSAEAGEGRAQTEENIVQSHMRPTQSGKRMSQGLHGVRPAARFAAIHPQ
jgi:hypothetical protein